ncbi:hydrolase TatD [Flavobacterium sp. 316]|uniref:TatD family hydrolase n=1 Tax=Flavobacterium sediminilitoris TaxID=2024526 RepID=A0ABY4HJB7_9FLAO|nr:MULTISPECIES: TatD family hydrolase [Flavobacterium]KIX22131.1 hydrolase TatD [Flavobacterium sp. 316]UOX32446.1 TatD family hydrolase [Flavobacterium sediminilitoris]
MKYVNLHTHSSLNDSSILEVVNQYPWEFKADILHYSIGIHPWYIKKERLELDLKCIEEKLQLSECLALGECGLDKRIEISLEMQIEVFKKQIELVKKTNKPIILHCVAAYQEIIRLKKEMNIQNPMIIHGFSKNEQVAKSLLDNGFYLSFGKYLLRNPELINVFKSVPDDKFFLETDTIEETIVEVYEKARLIKEMNLNELKSNIENNYVNVFGRQL